MAEGFVEVNLGDSEVLTMFLVVVACAYQSLPMKSDLDAPRSTGTEYPIKQN